MLQLRGGYSLKESLQMNHAGVLYLSNLTLKILYDDNVDPAVLNSVNSLHYSERPPQLREGERHYHTGPTLQPPNGTLGAQCRCIFEDC